MKTKRATALWWLRVGGRIRAQDLRKSPLSGPALGWHDPAGKCPLSGSSPACVWVQCRRPRFDSWLVMFPWRRDRLPTSVFSDFPDGSDSKEFTCSVGDLGSIPGSGRSPGGRHGNPFHYSCLENPHGQWSLVGYSPCGNKVSDTTE